MYVLWNMAWLGIVLSSPMGSAFTSAVVLGKHTTLIAPIKVHFENEYSNHIKYVYKKKLFLTYQE